MPLLQGSLLASPRPPAPTLAAIAPAPQQAQPPAAVLQGALQLQGRGGAAVPPPQRRSGSSGRGGACAPGGPPGVAVDAHPQMAAQLGGRLQRLRLPNDGSGGAAAAAHSGAAMAATPGHGGKPSGDSASAAQHGSRQPLKARQLPAGRSSGGSRWVSDAVGDTMDADNDKADADDWPSGRQQSRQQPRQQQPQQRGGVTRFNVVPPQQQQPSGRGGGKNRQRSSGGSGAARGGLPLKRLRKAQ